MAFGIFGGAAPVGPTRREVQPSLMDICIGSGLFQIAQDPYASAIKSGRCYTVPRPEIGGGVLCAARGQKTSSSSVNNPRHSAPCGAVARWARCGIRHEAYSHPAKHRAAHSPKLAVFAGVNTVTATSTAARMFFGCQDVSGHGRGS